MENKWESVFFAGLLILAFLAIVMMYRPTTWAREAWVTIDTQLTGESTGIKVAKLKLSLNEQEHIDSFPVWVGTYRGEDTPNVAGVRSFLKADTLLMRTYRDEEKWTQPVFLVLVHSSKGSSLHPPPICYTMQGYTLLGEQVVMITANDTALSRRIADEGSDSAGEWVSEKLGIANEAAVIPVNRLIVEKTDSNGSVDRRLVFYTYLKDKEFVQYEYCVVRVSGLIPVEGNIAAIEENLKAFMGETLSLIFEDVSVEKERVISIVTGLGWHGYLALALIFVIPLGMIIYPLAARKVFVRGEEPVEDEGEEETVIPEQPFTLPFNVEEKQGDEKILAAYYNAQAILARVTGIDPKSCPTLRDFREKVLPKLTQDVAGSFTELTGTAEALMYSTRGQDGETVERAAYLSEEIIGIMNERLPESVRLHPDS